MIQYKKLKNVMVCFILLLFTVSVFGQPTVLSREQMIEDIDILFSTIGEVHPDMFAIYPEEKLRKDIERIKSELAPSGNALYLFKRVKPLVAKLGDGHTFIRLPRDSEFFTHIFPFSVRISYPDKVVRVENDYTQTQNTIPAGAQITSINNRQVNDIVQEALNYVSGESNSFKISQIERRFSFMLHILYGESMFNIEYMYNQEKHSVQVSGISFEEFESASRRSNSNLASDNYTFRTLPGESIGIIEFNQFVDLDRFKVFLDSTFRILQEENIENLIIDIRRNGGGNSALGDVFFQYISPVPFAQFGRVIVRYSDIQREFHRRFGWEITNPNGVVVYNENPTLIELKKNDLRYKGNVFLLTSHSTFSSAVSFSCAFKYFNMGTIVGEETGGMTVTFGDVIMQRLPNSGLSYGISHKRFYHYGTTGENIHGTLPDYNVRSEKALDFAIDLMRRRK